METLKKIPVRQIRTALQAIDHTGKFSIRSLESVLNGNDLLHELHRHDFFFILALQSGDGIHEIDFQKHLLCDNSIFILRPGQVHQLELKANCAGYLVEFDSSFYQAKDKISSDRLKKATYKNFCRLDSDRNRRLIAVLTSIFDEFTEKAEGYREAIHSHLDIFFIELLRQSTNRSKIPEGSSGYVQERFEEFMGLLETNSATLKNVGQYADMMNLSPYQLNAITKTSVGKTSSELIVDQLILESKRYLLATPNQVKDIAYHLGYEDVSYFIRFFKKHTGYSPATFRENFR